MQHIVVMMMTNITHSINDKDDDEKERKERDMVA